MSASPKKAMIINILINDSMVQLGELKLTGPQGAPPFCRIEFSSTERQKLVFDNSDFFECLIDFRRVIEAEGGKILCAGARRDVFPSAMMRSSGCTTAYCLHLGRAASENDYVHIFDAIPANLVVTVDEQHAFYEQWLASLGLQKSGDRWFKVDTSKTPSPGEIEEAKRFPNGSISRIKADFEADEAVPLEAIEGFWKVDEAGRIIGNFLCNPHYDPSFSKE